MQHSNPSQHPPTVPFPFCLDEALARAYARAREACGGAEPNTSDLFAAHTANPAERAASARTDAAPEACSDPDRLDVGELLSVLREPIEWVFTLAERRAHGDAIDIAAIHRVREVVRARIASVMSGDGAATNPPRARAADLITIASLLIGTLDPAIVQRTALSFGGSLTDAIGALFRFDPSAGGHTAQAAMPFAGARGPRPFAPSCYFDDISRPAACFGGTIIPRAAVPTWCCPHGHVAL